MGFSLKGRTRIAGECEAKQPNPNLAVVSFSGKCLSQESSDCHGCACMQYVRQGSKPGGPQNSAASVLPGGKGALGEWNPVPGVGRGDATDRGGPRRPGQPRGNRLANADGGTHSFLTYTDFNLPPTK